MEFISKLISAIAFAVIIGVVVTAIINLILRICNYFAERKIKKQKREIALLDVENLRLSYELLMICRSNYHKAKYIEDSEERAAKQEELKTLYEEQVKKLSDPNFVSNKEYLTEKEIAELDEILSRPRYGLI